VVAALDAARGRHDDDVIRSLRLGRVDDLMDGLAATDADDVAVGAQMAKAWKEAHPDKPIVTAQLMALQALASGSPSNNPRVPSEEEIVGIYAQLLA
jgi:hypothetical protein